MFAPTSRYFNLETATLTTPEGGEIAYKRRRFLPQAENMQLLEEVTVTQSDRLDLIAARALGDPEQFWQIADANNALNPFELSAEPGRVLLIAVPPL